MRVCLYEDRGVADLEPLTLTRPVFDLLCGRTPLADKQRRFFAVDGVDRVVRPHLVELTRQDRPRDAVNRRVRVDGPLVLVNGRWLPPAGGVFDGSGPCVATVGDEVAYAVVEPRSLPSASVESVAECLDAALAGLPRRAAGGRLFRHLWELVDHNGTQLIDDWQAAGPPPQTGSPVTPAVVGPRDALHVDPSARIDPMVVVDTTGGPVLVEADAVVTAFTRLEGPCLVGRGTQVFGAKVRAGTTLGPGCRVGGEVEASILLGHVNKYHDGFLGHAYVGEWVNLGAGTQNSDLRNDYGEVRVMVDGRLTATGRAKVGCFLGDHTKTGLGALLNTGASVGVFCNLLPGGLLPRHVPSFTACRDGRLEDGADLESLLGTAARVMERRGAALTPAHVELYRAVREQTALERQRVLRDAEARPLRRSA
jgi:UDP-N-acetylglucosamine diphosphorylase / glucose-1-phosphate thymidylyltransferase / UDP-N-acetylgalactosamine diphosphorylase / glucosamine-1-phosphate N-acetyltransferase / galactosamine-1-phosphate N-acetyltransferase